MARQYDKINDRKNYFSARCRKFTVGGYVLHSPREGGDLMVTYSELFQFCLVLIGFAGLIFQICKRK